MLHARTLALSLAASLALTATAAGHFHVLLPQEYAQWSAAKGRAVPFRLVWGHGYEHIWMNAAKPAELFAVAPDGKRTDLLAALKPLSVKAADGKEYSAFAFDYVPAERGDFWFALKSSLIWDEQDGVFLQDYAKSVLHVQDKTGWDRKLGQKFELVPLNRPYGLLRGHVIRCVVLRDGKPLPDCEVELEKLQPRTLKESELPGEEFITFEAKSDANGVVAFGLHEEGWFALTAIYETDEQVSQDNHKGKLVERATLWINVAKSTSTGGP
jgi:cobalt/nickel transport protein